MDLSRKELHASEPDQSGRWNGEMYQCIYEKVPIHRGEGNQAKGGGRGLVLGSTRFWNGSGLLVICLQPIGG